VEIAGLSEIDWTAAWLAPFADIGRDVSAARDWRSALNRQARRCKLATADGLPLVFDAPDAAQAEAYEAFIARSGRVPTRANLHDFFNALMWLVYPRSKGRLNALQAAAIARAGVGATRGPLRDAATLIDENAVFLVTERADLVDALSRHDWSRLFCEQRNAWNGQIKVLAFGHAVLEKLVRPYKAITAHALHIAIPAASDAGTVDAAVASMLDERLSPRILLPLPVLGIPGWWAANAEPAFYSDAAVFRPPTRTRQLGVR
jgi:hypothetical protein